MLGRTPDEIHAVRFATGADIESMLTRGEIQDGMSLTALLLWLRERQPDLVGLQEVHQRIPQSGLADQPRSLRRATGMACEFGPALSIGERIRPRLSRRHYLRVRRGRALFHDHQRQLRKGIRPQRCRASR